MLPLTAGWMSFKLVTLLKLAAYRTAWWTGTITLWRRGKRTGRPRYKVLAVAVYVSSWALLLLGSSALWHWIKRLLSR